MRRLVLAMTIAAALAAAGCGSKSDADQVKEVTGDYLAAVADGKGSEACKRLTPEAKRDITTETNIACEQAIEQASKTFNDEQRKKVKDLEFDVKIDGDKATVNYDQPTGSGKNIARLEKRDGDWLIASG